MYLHLNQTLPPILSLFLFLFLFYFIFYFSSVIYGEPVWMVAHVFLLMGDYPEYSKLMLSIKLNFC